MRERQASGSRQHPLASQESANKEEEDLMMGLRRYVDQTSREKDAPKKPKTVEIPRAKKGYASRTSVQQTRERDPISVYKEVGTQNIT
jgi:hypothetical protein